MSYLNPKQASSPQDKFNYSNSFLTLTAKFGQFLVLLISVSLISINALAYETAPINRDIFNKSHNELLQLADEKRSSNNLLSIEVIKHLAKSTEELSTKQKEHLTYLQAYQYAFQANFDEAISLLNELINSSKQKIFTFRAHYTLVNIYAANQNWQAGLHHLTRLIGLSSQIFDDKLLQDSQIIIAIFYNQMGQYEEAINYIKKIKITRLTSKRNKCTVKKLGLLARLRLALAKDGDPFQQTELKKQLTKEIPKGIASCELANEALLANFIRTYQAELYLDNQQADHVLATLKPYSKEILATQYPILITVTDNLLAQAYWLKQDIVNTKKYALLAKENSQLLAQTKQTVATYKLLFQLAELDKDYPSALEYHKKYSRANQIVLDEIQAKHLAFQLASHNNFANKKEIEQLNQQNKLLNTQHQLSEQKQENSLLLIMLLLSFLAAFALWSYRSWLTQQRLKLLTEFDSLTKVYSRGHFMELAKSALKYCDKNEQPLTCVLFDLDYFKKINDQYGHSTGDNVLIKVAEVCQSLGRKYDAFGRLGGEEFAFILPGCSMIIAEDIANKCRDKISNIDYISLGIKQPITASFGVSDVAVSGFDLSNLLADADSAMYASKEHGRNCVNTYR